MSSMEGSTDFVVAIPARYSASRLPGKPLRLLAPTGTGTEPAPQGGIAALDAASEPAPPSAAPTRTHTVQRGESAWSIGRRYGIAPARLLRLNGLKADAVLRPGMVLKLDDAAG